MKKCSKCKEDKAERYFSKRHKSKVTGKQLYNSWCKKCSSLEEVERVKRKRKQPVQRKYIPPKNPINPKYLVRGLVTIGNRECSISCQA